MILVTLAYMEGWTDVRTDGYDVMAIKPNFLASMGYYIFLTMVLRARAPSARAELRYKSYELFYDSMWSRAERKFK